MKREDRQKIVDDFIKRHGVYDRAMFLKEVEADKKHPARDWFDWDDHSAAHKHRLEQATDFVRNLRITHTVENVHRHSVTITTPMVVSPIETRSDRGGYVLVKEGTMPALCGEAASALNAWIRRYQGAMQYAGEGKREEALRQLSAALAIAAKPGDEV